MVIINVLSTLSMKYLLGKRIFCKVSKFDADINTKPSIPDPEAKHYFFPFRNILKQ